MPAWLDRALRFIVVTPDMHRVHHSIIPAETNSNFGFNFSFWDRIFGTYRPKPTQGQLGMTIGLSQFREPRELWLDRLLTQPFRDESGAQPFSGRRPALTPPHRDDTTAT
jgi:sterol desaturase/sphingolipid hydroxylase (fatty acid hydroxylase superfamily)